MHQCKQLQKLVQLLSLQLWRDHDCLLIIITSLLKVIIWRSLFGANSTHSSKSQPQSILWHVCSSLTSLSPTTAHALLYQNAMLWVHVHSKVYDVQSVLRSDTLYSAYNLFPTPFAWEQLRNEAMVVEHHSSLYYSTLVYLRSDPSCHQPSCEDKLLGPPLISTEGGTSASVWITADQCRSLVGMVHVPLFYTLVWVYIHRKNRCVILTWISVLKLHKVHVLIFTFSTVCVLHCTTTNHV